MSFADEFKKLQLSRPRIALQMSNSENSAYTNYAFKNKNCYLVFGSHYNEDCYYLQYCYADKDSCDNDKIDKSELVFNSHHCFGCISRNHAEYEILNKKYSKEEWFKRVAEIKKELKREKLYGNWILPSTYPYEDTIAPLYCI